MLGQACEELFWNLLHNLQALLSSWPWQQADFSMTSHHVHYFDGCLPE